jgi:HK97 family phage major capsid protein
MDKKELRERKELHLSKAKEIVDTVKREGRNGFTADERKTLDFHMAKLDELDKVHVTEGSNMTVETRGTATDRTAALPEHRYTGDDSIEGKPYEMLRPDQSFNEWRRRAAENKVEGAHNEATDVDWNAYWAQRMGLSKPGLELRALGEDTTSGSGAAQAIVPQIWSTGFIDLIRPNLILHRAGATLMPMTSEIFNFPQYLADVAPVWISENTSNSLDTNPQFGTLQFNATGAYQDVTLISRQVAEDTNQRGGLTQLLLDTIGQKYARLVDQVGLYGTSGNAGNPGLVNETGLNIVYAGTNGAAPTDTTWPSIAAEYCRTKNVEPTAFVTNPQVVGTLSRITGSSGFPMYFPLPQDVAGIPWVFSSTVLGNETHGTGSNLSSFFVGDWSKIVIGMRVDLDVTVLKERYADVGQIGLWSYMRFSIRAVHPETFEKYSGIITT